MSESSILYTPATLTPAATTLATLQQTGLFGEALAIVAANGNDPVVTQRVREIFLGADPIRTAVHLFDIFVGGNATPIAVIVPELGAIATACRAAALAIDAAATAVGSNPGTIIQPLAQSPTGIPYPSPRRQFS